MKVLFGSNYLPAYEAWQTRRRVAMYYGKLKVFAGSSTRQLTDRICDKLSIDPGKVFVGNFADGEVRVEFQEDIRDADVFLVVALCTPRDWIEARLLADAAHRSSAGRVTLVITYLGYDRQDRKDKPRVPVSAVAMIRTLNDPTLGISRVLCVDVHSLATLSAFDPVVADHLYASIVAVPFLQPRVTGRFAVAAPDTGGTDRARKYASFLGARHLVIFDKRRLDAGKVEKESVRIIGSVRRKNLMFVDDMVDGGGTLEADAAEAKKHGALTASAFATHAVFSGNAVQRLDKSNLDELIITDTIWHSPQELATKRLKVTVLSVDRLLGQAIRRTHEGDSLSALFLKK